MEISSVQSTAQILRVFRLEKEFTFQLNLLQIQPKLSQLSLIKKGKSAHSKSQMLLTFQSMLFQKFTDLSSSTRYFHQILLNPRSQHHSQKKLQLLKNQKNKFQLSKMSQFLKLMVKIINQLKAKFQLRLMIKLTFQ
jgi:hypothetical protein